MESDVALQVWRPFRAGITAGQLRECEQGDLEVSELIQPNTMAIRVAGHRWNGEAIAQRCRLTIRNDRVSDHIGIVA